MRIELMIGGASIGATVFLPDRWRKHCQKPQTCRVMWLLHDKFDVSEDWVAYTQAEIFAGERNFALVAPSMSGGRYTDWINGCTWESFFPQFRDYIYEMFPFISRKKEDNFIFGFGQGGFAAIKYSLLSPESYGMVYSVNYNDWPAVETFTRQKLHEFKRAGNKLGYPEPEILEKSPDNIPWFAEKEKTWETMIQKYSWYVKTIRMNIPETKKYMLVFPFWGTISHGRKYHTMPQPTELDQLPAFQTGDSVIPS